MMRARQLPRPGQLLFAGAASFTLAWAVLFLITPRGPEIRIRWVPGLDEAGRDSSEDQLGLVRGRHVDEQTWLYELLNPTADHLGHLVTDARVEDTSGFNRAAPEPLDKPPSVTIRAILATLAFWLSIATLRAFGRGLRKLAQAGRIKVRAATPKTMACGRALWRRFTLLDDTRVKEAAPPSSWIKKLFLGLTLLALTGLPLLRLSSFLALGLATLVLVTGLTRQGSKRLVLVALAALGCIGIRSFLPQIQWEEGHNFFTTEGETNEPLAELLPGSVYTEMQAQFLRRYPRQDWCGEDDFGCWRETGPPQQLYAFSTDSALSSPKYSRRVNVIRFSGLGEFRGGFANAIGKHGRIPFINWWDIVTDVQRESMPFYVFYEIPPAAVGGSFCWTGTVFWPEASGLHFHHETGRTCRPITTKAVGSKVFGLSIEEPLEMDFTPSSRLATAGLAAAFLTGSAIVFVLLISVRIRPQASLRALALLAIVTLGIGVGDLGWYGNYTPFKGADDGLTHEGYGRAMLLYALEGDYQSAIEGIEPVFYFMPGLRYFRVLEKLLFGDTYLGLLVVALLLPLCLYLLLRHFLPISASLILLVTFLFVNTPVFRRFAWHMPSHLSVLRAGMAEPLGSLLFLIFLLGTFSYLDRQRPAALVTAGFSAALSVFVRPNIALGVAFMLLCLGFHLLKARQARGFALLCSSFLPVLLIPLHNLYFGDEFVLLTAAATIPQNLLTPPHVYLAAITDLQALHRIWTHLQLWAGTWYRPLAFLLLPVVAFLGWWGTKLRWLAISTLGLHVVLFFYQPDGRWAQLAWMMSLLVVFGTLAQAIRAGHRWKGPATRALRRSFGFG